MRYMGGKSRIASYIANIINEVPRWKIKDCNTIGEDHQLCGGACFVSLFCGSCSVESKVTGYDRIILNADTTGYNGEKFNSTEFWQTMRLLADRGHTVYISEQTAPPDFTCVFENPFTRTLCRNKKNQLKVTEKLFTYSG